MLKPDDPVWAELIADIEAVASGRYAEDPDMISGSTYAPSVEEPGFEFGALNCRDRQNVLADMIDWRHYENRGISHAQQRIVIANVLGEKLQEQWLDGVFAEAVLENEKIAGFKTMVQDLKNSSNNHHFEEMNGDHVPWDDLSAAAKLQYIVRDAAISDVSFEPFAEVVKNTMGDGVEAALRVVLEGQKELHAIAELFPDDGRTESTPVVDQVKEMLDYVSALENQEKEGCQNRERPFEGIGNSADGRPMPEEVNSHRGEDVLRDARAMTGADQPVAKAIGQISLRDLRNGSQDREKREEQQRGGRDMER